MAANDPMAQAMLEAYVCFRTRAGSYERGKAIGSGLVESDPVASGKNQVASALRQVRRLTA
jgi:hypothetical protein